MATRPRRISILRPVAITVLALALALILERLSFPSIPFSLSAGNSEFKAVYSELKGSESTLWAADPTEPLGRRKAILTVSHASGYGVLASLSPDGAGLAYGLLPEGRRDAFSDGQLWVASADGRGSRLIAGKMDLHFPPLWSPDSKSLLFKTIEVAPGGNPDTRPVSDGGKPDQRPYDLNFRSSLVVVSPDGPARVRAIVSSSDPNLYPIGWSTDGKSTYYYTVEADGSQAHLVDVATAETRRLGLLSGGPVWSVKLSPDRRRLLFLAVQASDSATRGTVWVFDQDTGHSFQVGATQPGPLGAIWHPSGDQVTSNTSQGPSRPGQTLLNTNMASGATQTFGENGEGTIAVPLSWSPDSNFLAVRRRSTATNDPPDVLAVLDTRSGQLKEIKGGYAEFVGWTTSSR
ncbi:MAG: hypothetical protein HYX94_00600 [Chloroflexi bacterium]|nr:hypothetical protein [Chloroflexota bacterium]